MRARVAEELSLTFTPGIVLADVLLLSRHRAAEIRERRPAAPQPGTRSPWPWRDATLAR
jgi:hypothetical protein